LKPYQSEVAARDEADLSLPACIITLDIPYFNHFVRTRRGEAPAEVRIDIQGTCRAIVGRNREARR
jgi:hypothetical protein